MNTVKAIRLRLGVSQAALAKGIEKCQGSISYIERGQTLQPEDATKLIAYAATLGVPLSYDQIYGAAELPPARIVEASSKAA